MDWFWWNREDKETGYYGAESINGLVITGKRTCSCYVQHNFILMFFILMYSFGFLIGVVFKHIKRIFSVFFKCINVV